LSSTFQHKGNEDLRRSEPSDPYTLAVPSPLGQDRCEALPGGRWRLACAPGRGWKARRARTFTSPETPGTAVRWEGTIWEVLEAGPAPGGGERYVLAPWDQRCVVRDLYDYGAAAEFARGREERDWTWRLRRRRIALLLAPLTGLLPGAVQARMELDWDLPAVAVTLISAVPLFFLGGYCAILSEVTQVAGAAGPPSGILLVGGYVFAESALRIGVAFCLSRPAGSVVGWVAYQVWRLAAGRRYEVSDTALSFSGGRSPLAGNRRSATDLSCSNRFWRCFHPWNNRIWRGGSASIRSAGVERRRRRSAPSRVSTLWLRSPGWLAESLRRRILSGSPPRALCFSSRSRGGQVRTG
jgi:hypothetical protein